MQAKIKTTLEDIFICCCGSKTSADLPSIIKFLWPVLNNSLTLVEICGMHWIAVSTSSDDTYDNLQTFSDFMNSIASIKYPIAKDSLSRLLSDFNNGRGLMGRIDSSIFAMLCDKDVMKSFLEYDNSLRHAFSTFCAKGLKLTSNINWSEMKKECLGMNDQQFLAFADAYNMIPNILTKSECGDRFLETFSSFPLLSPSPSFGTALLYPQFQLLLLRQALKGMESENGLFSGFAKKTNSMTLKPAADLIKNFFGNIGINKTLSERKASSSLSHGTVHSDDRPSPPAHIIQVESYVGPQDDSIVHPPFGRISDQYMGNSDYSKEAFILKIEKLFDSVLQEFESSDSSIQFIQQARDLCSQSSNMKSEKLLSSPVVIFDTIAPPKYFPDDIIRLINNAMAHNNLGNIEESLKSLHVVRVHGNNWIQSTSKEKTDLFYDMEINPEQEAILPHDFEVYLSISKGNLYQSCGDDEQAVIQYLAGLQAAKKNKFSDWEYVCMNCLGVVAYYNYRFDVAMTCFLSVANYRNMVR